MPNRIIKESIHASESISNLTDWQFRLWVNLITYVDDYGRGDARPAIIKGSIFPLRERVTLKDVEKGLLDLAGAGCVSLYEVGGKPYLYFPNWESHQRIQTKRSKFPAPQESTVTHRGSPPESESNPNPNPNTNPNPNDSAEPETASTPPVVSLPLNTGEEYPVFQTQVDEWSGLYPAVNVLQELRSMRGWCLANPTKRKTKSGVLRFATAWLAKEQNKGGANVKNQQNGNVFLDMLEERSRQ